MVHAKKFSSLLLLEFTLLGLVFCQNKNVIKLENGAYSNILIAINKNVTEDPAIIDNLEVTAIV